MKTTPPHAAGSTRPPGPDPFDLEIIANSLVAIGEEMFVTTQRTSQSTIVYEVLDFAVGITDPTGDLITQGNGVTLFLATLADAVRAVLEKESPDSIADGDVFVVNDPYVGGGTHLSDVTVVMPVMNRGVIVAFVCNKAHWTEVGGAEPGSVSATSTEIYQEGIQLPCVKLVSAGVENRALIDVIKANVRVPDMSIGDMYAQLASVRLASGRIREICEKYGPAMFDVSVRHMLEHSAAVAREQLRALPAGVYTAEDHLEGPADHDPVPIKVRVTVDADTFECDFTGTHPQLVGPTNCTRTGLNSAARIVFKAIVDPHSPLTEGTFAPLRVVCPDGTVFTARRPAATSLYWEVLGRVVDLVWHALAEAVPSRTTAGHFATTCADLIAGPHPRTNELFILFEPNAGGWGAGEGKDGERGLVTMADGETYMIPVEVLESKYGVLVEQYAFNTSGAGAGKWRGGEGVVRDYRIVADDVTATGISERSIFPPWGAAGGAPGSPSGIDRLGPDGTLIESLTMRHRPVARNEIVRIRTGTGGGWGDPMERDPEMVAADVRNDFVTVAQARDVYGVIVNDASFAVVGLTDEGEHARVKAANGRRP